MVPDFVDASSRFVPKVAIRPNRPGWRACIVKGPSRPMTANRAARAPQAPPPGPVDTPGPVGDDDLVMLRSGNAHRPNRQRRRGYERDRRMDWRHADPGIVRMESSGRLRGSQEACAGRHESFRRPVRT